MKKNNSLQKYLNKKKKLKYKILHFAKLLYFLSVFNPQ